MKDLLSLKDWNNETIKELIKHAADIKANPEDYYNALPHKSMLMIFEKPSLRTRLSFEAGMTQLGGHAIYLDVKDAPLGEKESISDTAKASSKYVDIIMARLYKQEDLEELASSAEVPVINGLTDLYHPCQILSDLFTIYEKKKDFPNLKLSYVGDGNNNVTHSLLLGCSAVGMDISVGSPEEYSPQPEIVKIAEEQSESKVEILNDAQAAVEGADIVYTDSWMSYHIPKEQEEDRINVFKPFQVNKKLMEYADKDAIFMNCLPAMRGYEQTAEVIDGLQSIVFDQAENRLHMQKAIILRLLNKL